MNRKEFLALCSAGILNIMAKKSSGKIMTINGLIDTDRLGKCLVHEHFLVDFIGADKIDYKRWDRNKVVGKVLPYLKEAKQFGIETMVDCTPAYLGRDVQLLQMLSERSGLQMVTTTGLYGAFKNKYLPPYALSESAAQLAKRWIAEFENGIEGTKVKPGIIKISVDANDTLTSIHAKLVEAAAITHLATGLAIFSHTGPAAPAIQQLDILRAAGVKPGAFVWVHAQAEKDKSKHVQLAKQGAWVSLDGIGWGDYDDYAAMLQQLKSASLLHRVVISHDAGWYKPDEPAGEFIGYKSIFTELFPRLTKLGFNEDDFKTLLFDNPSRLLMLDVKK